MSNDCCDKGKILDAECCYDSGKFFMGRLPRCLPRLFTVRFTAPADYTADDVIIVDGKELPVRTPGMAAAASDIFKAGAVIHCDIDLDRELAFFWQGGGSGTAPAVLPNLSYAEQFAGYFDEDGNKVYMKTIDFGTLPIKSSKSVPHNIINFSQLMNVVFRRTAPSSNIQGIGSFPSSGGTYIHFIIRGENLVVSTDTTTEIQYGKFVLFYTCTDR